MRDTTMTQISRFSFPTQIRYGVGARSTLAEFAAIYNVKRPLLATDTGMPSTDAFRLIIGEMDKAWPGSYAQFTGAHANPTEQDVEDAWKAYADARCDAVVGLGGGSALDVAKAARLKVAFPNMGLMDVPMDRLPERLVPFCAVPTTSGTGSEVGRTSVITVPSLGRKTGFCASQLMADLAILDPTLTVGLPPHLTASTGMDAMTHAIESFVCPMFHPMCDAIALESVRLARIYLPRAHADGSDLEARGMMQLSSTMGAVAFQKDLGAAHSLSHPLSSEYGVQHGLANAIALPPVTRFNGEEDSLQYRRIAVGLGIEPDDDPASRVADFLDDFNRSIGITQRLCDLDVPRDKLPALAALAIQDVCHQTNPRKCTEADMLRLYEEMYE